LQQANNSSTVPSALSFSTASTTRTDNSGRLTRAAFTKTLEADHHYNNYTSTKTLFAIPGLSRLKHTFLMLDDTKLIVQQPTDQTACRLLLEEVCDRGGGTSSTTSNNVSANAADASTIAVNGKPKAQHSVARGDWDPSWLPGAREYSELLSQPKEVFGESFQPPCRPDQIHTLKRDRNQFTAAEDSLVFRGVVRFKVGLGYVRSFCCAEFHFSVFHPSAFVV
jgi:hypothetical protein